MSPAAVLAHGIGGRADLPLPPWLFGYGAGMALLISFVGLRILWPRPQLEGTAEGVSLPAIGTRPVLLAVEVAARAVGVVAYVAVVAAALVGPLDSTANLAPVAVFVVFWVGLQAASALFGDIWRVLSPWDTVALMVAPFRRGRRAGDDAHTHAHEGTHWPAAAGIFAFIWFELCYHDPGSPRVLAVALLVYGAAMVLGATLFGRRWLRTGDGFAVWFSLLAAMAPFARDDEGRLRLRPPFAGLSHVVPRRGTAAVVLIVLSSTAYDGLSETPFGLDVLGYRTGWAATGVSTLGLGVVVAVVALSYIGAMRLAARLTDRPPMELVAPFLHSLVPIALAYGVAHYFSLFVFEGQTALALASDPLGRGADLFGTSSWTINYLLVTGRTIAYVQVAAIVVGHVAAVVVAHDRSVQLFDRRNAGRSQEPLIGVMVTYTVVGLALLLGA